MKDTNEQKQLEVPVEERSVITYLLQKVNTLSQQLDMTRSELNQHVQLSASRLGVNLDVSENGKKNWRYEESSGVFIEVDILPDTSVEVKDEIHDV